MKVRTDFVSNSSSTSYTVELNSQKSIKDYLKSYAKKDPGPQAFDYVILDNRKLEYSKLKPNLARSLREHLNAMEDHFEDYQINEFLDEKSRVQGPYFIRVDAAKFFPYLMRVRNYGLGKTIRNAITLIYCQTWVDLSYWEATHEEPWQKLTDWLSKKKIAYDHSECHD